MAAWLLVIIIGGPNGLVTHLPFNSEAACQNAKKNITTDIKTARPSTGVGLLECYPTSMP
jgi:hypothetical protein